MPTDPGGAAPVDDRVAVPAGTGAGGAADALPVLELDRVSHRYGDGAWVLRGLSLSLARGTTCALLGESGVGKSTLLNLAAGLERPLDGRVRIGGVPIESLDDDAVSAIRRRQMGFVFQAFHLLPHLRVWQNVALPLLLDGRDEAQAAADVDAVLERVGLLGRREAWPDELSGGQQQRVAVARAIVHRPALVLADEPTGNLDPATARATLDVLEAAVRERGAALLLVTHSHAAARRMDRCLELRADGLHDAQATAPPP